MTTIAITLTNPRLGAAERQTVKTFLAQVHQALEDLPEGEEIARLIIGGQDFELTEDSLCQLLIELESVCHQVAADQAQHQLESVEYPFQKGLQLFLEILKGGGTHWAEEFGPVEQISTEGDLLKATTQAAQAAWDRHSGQFNGPNIPELKFRDREQVLEYRTCHGTVIRLRGWLMQKNHPPNRRTGRISPSQRSLLWS